MRRLLIALAVVAAVVVAVDFGLRWWVERWFAGRVDEALQLQGRPDLDLGGFPFTVAFVRGRLPSAGVEGEGLMVGGLNVARFRADLRTVRFPPGALISGGTGTIRAASGSGAATVTQEDLTAYLNFQGYRGRIDLAPGRATVVTESAVGEVHATGSLAVEDGRLVFRPDTVEAGGAPAPVPASAVAFSFELERPFPGVAYSGIAVGDGEATLDLRIRDARIDVTARE